MRDHAQADTLAQKFSTRERPSWMGALLVGLAGSLFMRRWLLPVPFFIFVVVLSLPDLITQAAASQRDANIWDGTLIILANPYVLVYLATPLFVYLIGDMIPENNFGDLLLLRLQSRRVWWLGKVATLMVAVIAYLLLLLGVVVGIASFVLPWESRWSALALQSPNAVYLPPQALTFTPLVAVALTILLLALGWFAIGMLVLVVSQLFNNAKAGFGAGFLLTIIAIIVLHADIAPPFSNIFINNHLLFNLHAFGDPASPYPSLLFSVGYWMAWMITMFFIGLWLSARHDFLRRVE